MRNSIAALAALFALSAAPLAAQGPPAQQPGEELVDRVVAVVGDTTLLYSDVVQALEQLRESGQTVPTDPAQRDLFVRRVVEQRVSDLVLLEAARASGLAVTEADVADVVERQVAQVRQRFNNSDTEMARALLQSGRTVDEFRRDITRQAIDRTMIQRFTAAQMAKLPRPTVSDEEARAYFETVRAQVGQRPANVSFEQALVKPVPSDSAKARARRTAVEVLAELGRGGDFEVLARRYSADASKEQGGSLGWFREGQMVRPFEAAAFSMRPGQTSDIVETEFGYHIIRLDRIRGPERQARHILIRPEITPEDVARARTRADSIAAAVRAGASLPQLAATTSTPGDQRVNRNVPVEQLPPAYALLGTAQTGAVVGPFEIPDPQGSSSFAVARVTAQQAAGQLEYADVADRVKERLQEQRMQEQLLAELRRNTHVAIQI
ncbi:MAG: Periplasmic chaperone and peptidyl-prolyl cis-trans isomerase of outer membrane proteins SurA [uncultured Gemmatimonadetes bacterium]|uniref:Periplasmic chaperone and peptidyl-prolyl cis-trans isomerase of outer membrane proteins SurA n=1 Tax=uncultured Gemmatimonadota bacterium TaxID=203437 RepID=A0A6J4KM35_9BACT|nr:MAG: Periplasmic chaperone and peptidyl-prolyl cis-trans isomerase of outer membrane proteins SurA [uncultured Gemmatimonadota bacterium]